MQVSNPGAGPASNPGAADGPRRRLQGALPQGHDAWVVGDEPVVVVDWYGASNYARA
jgi:hypothetical protein